MTGEPRVIAQNVDVISPNQITCEFDLFDAPSGLLDVVVRNPDGQRDTLAGGFAVIPAPEPEVAAVSPNTGNYGEVLYNVEVTGNNFIELVLVSLLMEDEDAVEATNVVMESPQLITCRLDLRGVSRGDWDVVVTNRDDQADTLPDGFYVIPIPDPEVYSVTPDSGITGLGLSLSPITGANFVDGTTIKLVNEGEPDVTPYRTDFYSATTITCEFNLGGVQPGDWDVIVTNPDNGADTLTTGLQLLPGMWGEDVRLTDHPNPSLTSDNNARCIAVDSDGHLHVVWDDVRGFGREIYYKHHDGAVWGEDVQLTDAGGTSADPAVTVDASSNVHVVWNSNRDGPYNIYYKMFDGDTWSADQQLSSGSCGGQFASVAGDDTGAVHVVWEDCRDGNTEIYYRRFDGATWSAEQRLTYSPGISRFPSIAADGYNHVHVVWYDYHLGSGKIHYLKSTLPMSWAPAENLTPGGSGTQPCVTANSAGHVHVVWQAVVIYHKKHNGVEWEDTYRVTQSDGTQPSVGVDDEGNVHVIWVRDGTIYCIGYDGVEWGGVGKFRAAPQQSEKGSIAVGNDGRVHVVWRDGRDGNSEIYYKSGDPERFAGIVDAEGPEPKFAVTGIAPNPVGGDARVAFTTASRSDTEITIFDVRGRLVWQRLIKDLDPGRHSIVWHVRDDLGHPVSPGVYFIRLQAGTQTGFAKAVVLR
jgi:hypothetical protein